jgi:predicted HTH transcriptional regulator
MADADRFRRLIELGREDRFLEYKESGIWSDLKDNITKTALGMTNIRDGGTIIIGVSERSGQFVPTGMLAPHLATYREDTVRDCVHEFADPYIRTELHHVPYNDKIFVAIVVHEFDLVRGRMYTRAYRKAETCEIPTQAEMREIIDVATDKAVRRLVRRLSFAGISLEEAAGLSDKARFEREREGL